MRVISYGGGVQSTAMIVLAVQGRIPDIDAALFANVGDDSEHPDTLRYVRDVARPYAHAHGLPVCEIGRGIDLAARVADTAYRSIPIPVYVGDGAPGTRQCTARWKIGPVQQWLRDHGATRQQPAEVLIGISVDEILRLNNRRAGTVDTPVYPLIDLGLSRADCERVIADAGLPVPGKSSCYFCPFQRPSQWVRLAETRPDLFAKAQRLEAAVLTKRAVLGRDPAYLTRFGAPLVDVIDRDQLPLIPLGADGCDSGYCFT